MGDIDIVDVLLDLLIDKMKEHPTVFTTGLTLDERFTQNERQGTFPGDDSSQRRKFTGTRKLLGFRNQRNLNPRNQFTRYRRTDLGRFRKSPTEMENGLKPKFRELAYGSLTCGSRSHPGNRESDGKFYNFEPVKQIEVLETTARKPFTNWAVKPRFSSREPCTTWKRGYPYRYGKFSRFSEFGNNWLRRRFEQTSSSFDDNGRYVYNYCPASVYKRRRGRLPAKQELDDELDRYMTEIKYKMPDTDIVEDVDLFVKEYMMETGKCLNQV